MSKHGEPWTAAEEAIVLAMYIRGTSTASEVARAIGTRQVGSNDVYMKAAKLRRRLGIVMEPRVPERTVKDWDLVAALFDEHMTADELAEMFGVGVGYIRQQMRKRGYSFHTNGWRRLGKKLRGRHYV